LLWIAPAPKTKKPLPEGGKGSIGVSSLG
jgi:hypothetical protein